MTVRYRGTLAYDGTAYQGFQRQKDGVPTVQGAFERAAQRVIGQPVTVLGAGRTDSGVHASGQVIAFDAAWRHSVERLRDALNAALPEDIALRDLEAAPSPAFHPRFDAFSREYQYLVLSAPTRDPLLRRRAWHVRGALDGEAMAAAGAALIGTHDFAAFGTPPKGDNSVRTVFRSQWQQETDADGTLWRYTIEANAFLLHMVRRIVGVLVRVGRGGRAAGFPADLLRERRIPPGLPLAPPQGLTLVKVRYRAGETPAQAITGNGS